MTRALIYARCSTSEQDYTRQLEELRAAASRNGWEIVAEIGSFVSGRENASDLNEITSRAHRGEFDRLMVWELSRLTRRGIGPLLHVLSYLEGENVQVWSASEQWVSQEGPQRELLLAILGWVTKWERDMISARTKSALASRKALGIHVGRPKGSKDKKPRAKRGHGPRGYYRKGSPLGPLRGTPPAENRPLLAGTGPNVPGAKPSVAKAAPQGPGGPEGGG